MRTGSSWQWRRTGLGVVGLLLAGISSWAAEPNQETIAGKELTMLRDQEHVAIKQGQQLLLRYRYHGSSHKPYVKELSAPGLGNILRDAPADHLHHHGLMFAVRVNGVNFWEETPASGKEVHKTLRLAISKNTGTEAAVLQEQLDWQDKDGKSLLHEERVVTVYAERPGRPRLFTWQSSFTPSSGPVPLSGTVYHGLAMLFLQVMDAGGEFRNSHDAAGVDATKGKQASWCAYTAEPTAGKPVTIAMFDSPANPRHPSRWYTMNKPFAYLSATLGLDKEPCKLDQGQRLTLTYGVAVFPGEVAKEVIEPVYKVWQQLIASAGK